MQLIVGLDSPFVVDDRFGKRETDLAVIAANEPHQVKSDVGPVLLVLADPHSAIGRELSAQGTPSVGDMKHVPLSDGEGMRKALITALGLADSAASAVDMDPRIVRALQHIKNKDVKKISLSELAGVACLSESRFAHLFKKQVGLPVRRYVLWERLMKAVDLFAHGASLTEAAHEADFSDQAHLARTVKAHFGLSVRDLKNSQFLQVRCHQDC